MVVVHPPADGFGKIADHVVQHIFCRNVKFKFDEVKQYIIKGNLMR